MLEGEHDDVLDSLKGRRPVRPRESFGDDDSDTPVRISGVPMHLIQSIHLKRWEVQIVGVAVSVDLCLCQHPLFHVR